MATGTADRSFSAPDLRRHDVAALLQHTYHWTRRVSGRPAGSPPSGPGTHRRGAALRGAAVHRRAQPAGGCGNDAAPGAPGLPCPSRAVTRRTRRGGRGAGGLELPAAAPARHCSPCVPGRRRPEVATWRTWPRPLSAICSRSSLSQTMTVAGRSRVPPCACSAPACLPSDSPGRTAEHGVACVAAVGDGGGPIAQPSALPGVLAVGAVGQLGSFPPGSGIAAELTGPPTPDGLFAPRFANYGPGMDCCAPGVAIVSGLPPASYGRSAAPRPPRPTSPRSRRWSWPTTRSSGRSPEDIR